VVTGVSFNGVALTREVYDSSTTNYYHVDGWYLTETTYGSNLGGVTANVQVTHGGKCSGSGAVAVDLISVDQSDPVQGSQWTYTSSNPVQSVTVSGAVSGSMTVGVLCCGEGDTSNVSVTAGTELGEWGFGPSAGSSAYRADSGTLTWYITNSESGDTLAINFNEATGGPAIVNIETAMAVTGALTAGVSHLIPIAAAPGGSSSLQAVVGNIIPVASAMDVIGGLVADVSVLGAGAVLQAMYLYRRRRT